MIIGIGCDVVEHEVIKVLNWHLDEKLRSRIFSTDELALFTTKNDIKFLSGRFAAKEAVVKCLGIGMKDGIDLTDIHILKSNIGKPTVRLTRQVNKISESMGINNWLVSITHATEYTMAFVVAEG